MTTLKNKKTLDTNKSNAYSQNLAGLKVYPAKLLLYPL